MESKDKRLERPFENLTLPFTDESRGRDKIHVPKVTQPGLKDRAPDFTSVSSFIHQVSTRLLPSWGAAGFLTSKKDPCFTRVSNL